MSDDVVIKLVAAINLRNRCRSGLEDQDWVREQALALVEIGFWNDPQIAEIVGYSRQQVTKLARDRGAVRPAEAPKGGRLASGSLDGILELLGTVRGGGVPNQMLLQAVISTGTSTKLISRLTGIPIGTVLYQQRKLKKGTIMEECKGCSHLSMAHGPSGCQVDLCECTAMRS